MTIISIRILGGVPYVDGATGEVFVRIEDEDTKTTEVFWCEGYPHYHEAYLCEKPEVLEAIEQIYGEKEEQSIVDSTLEWPVDEFILEGTN